MLIIINKACFAHKIWTCHFGFEKKNQQQKYTLKWVEKKKQCCMWTEY